MSRPAIELLLGPDPAPALIDVLRSLGRRWARLEAWVDDVRPTARIVTVWTPAAARSALEDPAVPAVIWFDQPDELELFGRGAIRAAAVIGPAAAAQGVPGSLSAPVPERSIDGSMWHHASPFVRGRRRALYRLPDDLVVTTGTGEGPELDDAAIAAALGAAAAAVVVGPWALPALAMGTPIATDERTAAWLDLTDGVEAVIADADEPSRAAAALAADPRAAARVGWAGRRHIEERFDTAVVADRLAAALQLSRASSPLGGVRSVLASLRTPPGSIPSTRAARALAGLGPETGDAVRAWAW